MLFILLHEILIFCFFFTVVIVWRFIFDYDNTVII